MNTTFDPTITLALFYFPQCPFCQRVLSFLKQQNIQFPLWDIHQDQKAAAFLLEKTQRQTVPCLYHNGQFLFESLDIIHFLDQKFRQSK
jgi:glutaredoxin 3